MRSPRPRRMLAVWIVAAGVALLLGLLLASTIRGPATRPTVTPTATPTGSATSAPSSTPLADAAYLLAVGDTASCDNANDSAVAAIAAALPGEIALLGDLAYENGTEREFAECFDPVWGPMRDRLRPALGNHEYGTGNASGYFAYFGDAVGRPDQGWYAYDIGSWRAFVLNSNCRGAGGCDADSAQLAWLRAELADPPACTLAYWHHPRYSTGYHGNDDTMADAWSLLAAAGNELVLGGHDHSYERILAEGMREFVVGTGGRSLYPFPRLPFSGTEVRDASSYGLLELTLAEGSYAWRFLPAGDGAFTDTGSGICH